MGIHRAVSALANVVDVVVGIGLGVGGSSIGLLGLGAELEFHDGGETHLGVGIGKGGTLGHGLGSDHELVGLYSSLEVGVGEDVNLGAVDLGVHGVVHVEGIGGGYLIGGLGDHELEGAADGNVHLGVVGEGEHHVGSGNLNVLEDAILEGRAALEAAQLLLLTGNHCIQLAVLHIDVGYLAHQEVLAFELEDFSVDGPAQLLIGVLHHGEGTGAAGRDLEGDHGAVSVGNGDAFVGLFYLLDILAQSHGIGSLHLGFQIAYLGFKGGDTVSELRVIVLFGAAHQGEGYSKSR